MEKSTTAEKNIYDSFLNSYSYIEQSVEFNSSIRNEYFDASTPARSDYHSAIASSTPMPPTPTGRGRPKGSSSLKSSKKAAKASASFSAGETDKKSTSFENQSTMLDPQVNVSQNIDEQVSIFNQNIQNIKSSMKTSIIHTMLQYRYM